MAASDHRRCRRHHIHGHYLRFGPQLRAWRHLRFHRCFGPQLRTWGLLRARAEGADQSNDWDVVQFVFWAGRLVAGSGCGEAPHGVLAAMRDCEDLRYEGLVIGGL